MPYSAAVQQRPAHEPALDGLRGIAALIVVIRHAFNAQWIAPELRLALAQSPVALALNGQGAVQLFFVLSGFVLAGSLARSAEAAPWPQFFVRRVFRIHPPYVVAVLLALACAALAGGATGPTLHPAAPPPPDGVALARFLAFPGKAGGSLPVGWTLTIEMVFSFLLPLLVLAAGIARGAMLLLACVALLFGVDHDFARYAIDFALGVLAFRERDAIAGAMRRIGPAGRGTLVVLGLVLWCAPLLFWARMLRGYLMAGWFPYEIAVMAAGAALLVVCAIEVPYLRRVLSAPACLFLGRISYASYLIHWTLLTLLAPRLVDRSAAGNAMLLVSVLVATTLLSVPFHRYVELPSIALGNRVSRALAARLGARAVESRAGRTD
jgi:peptidoglycan/LPS O-acetylase OafA/YrhL